MEYQFSFSKPRFLLLCAAIFVAGLLIFAGGVVTGKTTGTALPRKWNPAAKAASAKSALKLPALPGAKPAANPATSPADAMSAPDTEAPAVAGTIAAKPGESVPPPAVAVAASAAMPDMAGQPFVLQLGAFREQKSAKVLQTSLKERGYTAAILNMVDEDQRTWHMVRLGGYKDLSAASKAASDFTGKEGIQALVRRSDSL